MTSPALKTEPDRLRRQYELRKRREAIIRELTRPRALSDLEVLALTRELRDIQFELNEYQRVGVA